MCFFFFNVYLYSLTFVVVLLVCCFHFVFIVPIISVCWKLSIVAAGVCAENKFRIFDFLYIGIIHWLRIVYSTSMWKANSRRSLSLARLCFRHQKRSPNRSMYIDKKHQSDHISNHRGECVFFHLIGRSISAEPIFFSFDSSCCYRFVDRSTVENLQQLDNESDVDVFLFCCSRWTRQHLPCDPFVIFIHSLR